MTVKIARCLLGRLGEVGASCDAAARKSEPAQAYVQSSVASSCHVPSQQEVVQHFGPVLLQQGRVYTKTGCAFLKQAAAGELVETALGGEKETEKRAREGDWIVRADTTAGERFLIGDATFRKRYLQTPVDFADHPCAAELAAEGFQAYRPNGQILGVEVTLEFLQQYFPEEKFVAPWGSEMLVREGDIIACQYTPYLDAVTSLYRIEQNSFRETYVPASCTVDSATI